MNHITTNSVVLVFTVLTVDAYAQSPVNGAIRVPGTAERKTRFETDTRLDRQVSISPRNVTHSRVWGMLWRRSGAHIECDEAAREVADSPLMVAATDASVRSIMDALAALVDARWKYAQRKTYILLVGERELDQVFMPNSEWEKDRFRAGRPFLDALGGLSASQSAEIESGSKMQFTDLPANLHQPISDMLTSLSREYRDKGAGDTVSPTNLSRCTVRVQRKPASGFNRLFITVTDPGVVTSGWRLNDYEAQKVARESAEQAKSGVALDIYAARSARMSQAEAKLITRLKQKVTIELPDATFVRVLKHIHEAHGISFVCDAEQYMPQRANVRIVNMALSDALDKLVDLYKGTEWEWRKMGVLVVRGPANPVRQKPEDKLKPHQ